LKVDGFARSPQVVTPAKLVPAKGRSGSPEDLVKTGFPPPRE